MQTLFEVFRVNHWGEFWWIMVGFLGQALFSMRFLDPVDHVRARPPVGVCPPPSGTFYSLGGGLVLLTYAIYRRDPVFILGQGMGLVIYARNLWLIHAANRPA